MMTHLWVYDGALDPSERALTLEAEGPTDDHRVLSSYTLGADGTWQQFMTVRYRRKK
jgi:Protein of unknown function (DUF1579)